MGPAPSGTLADGDHVRLLERHFLEMRILVVLGVVMSLALGACGGDARSPVVVPTTTAPLDTVAFSAPPADLTTVPPLVITTPQPTDDESQTPEDAARDGVVPALARLPVALRVAQATEDFGATRLEAPEGTWMISSPSPAIPNLVRSCLLGNSNGTVGLDVICIFEYGEILLLEPGTGRILRAYPFASIGPQALVITDDAVYCIRQGDGALPDSMLCRIDRSTLEATVRVFPSAIDSAVGPGSGHHIPANWIIDEPTNQALWQRLIVSDGLVRISGLAGTAKVDPLTLEIIEVTEG